jgi:hypothetical protein
MCVCARVFMNERDQRCILISHVRVPISRVRESRFSDYAVRTRNTLNADGTCIYHVYTTSVRVDDGTAFHPTGAVRIRTKVNEKSLRKR